MKDIPGLIRLEREDSLLAINPDYRLWIVVDSEKISVKKITNPLEDILKEMREEINSYYDKIGSLASRVSDIKAEATENDSIKGFSYHVPTLVEKEVKVDIKKLDRKRHELILNYKLWDAPFSVYDIFSPQLDGVLDSYVNLLAAIKRGEKYLPSHIKFDGTLKQMIDVIEYLHPDLERDYRTHINVGELQILGRKDFMFTKATDDGLITKDYQLTEKGRDYLKEVLPKIDIKLFAIYPFLEKMENRLNIDEFLYEMVSRASLVDLLQLQKKKGDVTRRIVWTNDLTIRRIAWANNLVPDELYLGVAAYVMNQALVKGHIKRENDQIRALDKETISFIDKFS